MTRQDGDAEVRVLFAHACRPGQTEMCVSPTDGGLPPFTTADFARCGSLARIRRSRTFPEGCRGSPGYADRRDDPVESDVAGAGNPRRNVLLQ